MPGFGSWFRGVEVGVSAISVGDWPGPRRICNDRSGMYQYFVKVVPTEYHFLNKTGLSTFQFASTQHYRKLEGLQVQPSARTSLLTWPVTAIVHGLTTSQ